MKNKKEDYSIEQEKEQLKEASDIFKSAEDNEFKIPKEERKDNKENSQMELELEKNMHPNGPQKANEEYDIDNDNEYSL